MASKIQDVPAEERRAALNEAYLSAWNSHDAEAVGGFFAPGALYDDRGAAEVAHGPEEIAAHAARVFEAFPDLRFQIKRIAEGEDFSAGEWRATMTHQGDLFGLAATGRKLSAEGVDVATFGDDDLITHLVSYYDGAAMMRELGLLPGRHSRAERIGLRLASLRPRRLR
jgi:steroid delta-isomerase-like uncharacterized protein